MEEGAILEIYDPKVNKYQIENELGIKPIDSSEGMSAGGEWIFSESLYKSSISTDAIIILTEWDEFRAIDWGKISNNMRKPAWLFDTRNIADHDSAKLNGINVWQLGSNKL